VNHDAGALKAAPAVTSFALLGTVVPMTGVPETVIQHGAVYVRDRKIVDVRDSSQPPPSGFPQGAPRISTGGVLYPGLFDLHNHLPYNIRALWNPLQRFDRRNDWLSLDEYHRNVSEPVQTIVHKGGHQLQMALVRYVETKLLLGGVTSVQGMGQDDSALFLGLLRNLEAPDDTGLAGTLAHVADLKAADVAKFASDLNSGKKMFYHLCEGLPGHDIEPYTFLQQQGFVRQNLVGIHSLALGPAEFQALAQLNSHVVWSPLSNCILYGNTIDVRQLVSSGVHFGIGSDWAPTGSRNILLELKVARLCSEHVQASLSAERLTAAVTRDAAEAAGWNNGLGSLEAGKLADLTVIAGNGLPFENLVAATEKDVQLVVIDGQPRYGDSAVMRQFPVPVKELEPVTVGGRSKSLYLTQPASPLNGMSFKQARQLVESALSNLADLRAHPRADSVAAGARSLVHLDMPVMPQLFALAPGQLLNSVPMDLPTVVDDHTYFDTLDGIAALPKFLTGANGLRRFYS
jgi:cytosine/adenosine deaminase-related metal-dependent hydrolase